MTDSNGKKDPLSFIFIASAAVVVVLSWAFVFSELKARELESDYDIFRLSADVLEYARETGELPDDSSVSGAALYRADGTPFLLEGGAPPRFDPSIMRGLPFIVIRNGNTTELFRALGPEMMSRMPQGRRSEPSISGSPKPPPHFDQPFAREAVFSYIAVSSNAVIITTIGYISAALFVSLVAAGASVALAVFRKKYGEALMREERTRELVALGEASRTLAHEIKNPLGVIRIQCALISENADERVSRGISIIDEEAKRLASLADRIREFLSSGEGNPAVFDAVTETEKIVSKYPGVPFTGSKRKGVVRIDRSRFESVLDNLVKNALESVQDLQDAAGNAGAVGVEIRLDAKRIIIDVSDSGSGISEENQKRLFTPFFTTKIKGSGIGLAISKRFAEASGGSLKYTPGKGGGSVFSFSLPLAEERQNESSSVLRH